MGAGEDMKSLSEIKALTLRYGPWLLWAALPFALNQVLWAQVTSQATLELHRWRGIEEFIEYRPKLEALLIESGRLSEEGESRNFFKDDPAAAVQLIERLAGANRVEVQKVDLAEEDKKNQTLALSVEVMGSFDKLAHFINDIENQTGLEIHSWVLTPSRDSSISHQLKITLSIFSRATSRAQSSVAPAGSYGQMLKGLSRAIELYQKQGGPQEAYNVVFRRDPVRSLVDEDGKIVHARGLSDSLAVQGIVRSKDLELALVNDRFFKAGDQVGPYKILEIKADGLSVERDGKTTFVPLYPQTEKKAEFPGEKA